MIKNIFPIQVYETKFENYTAIKENLVDNLLFLFKEEENQKLSMRYNTSSNKTNLHDNPNLSVVFDFINLHINNYWNNISEMDPKYNVKPYILNTWINIIPIGKAISSHNHNPCIFGGVFYVDADHKNGNLFLENPLDYLLGRMPWIHNPLNNPKNFSEEISVFDGKLILFPGWMKHYSSENVEDKNRISIGINVGCHGKYITVTENY